MLPCARTAAEISVLVDVMVDRQAETPPCPDWFNVCSRRFFSLSNLHRFRKPFFVCVWEASSEQLFLDKPECEQNVVKY